MGAARINRRTLLGFAAAVGAAGVTGCGNSLGGATANAAGGATIKIGLVIPQSGVYAPLGEDIRRGWELWLARNGGKLGGLRAVTVVADEGEGPQTGVPAVQQLLQRDQVDVLVGIVNSATALGVRDLVGGVRKLLLIANAGAGEITGSGRSPYIWRTSFTNAQVAAAMGRHLAGTGLRRAYAIAPDYVAGAEAIAGFSQAFRAGGGTIAGESRPPFGKTQDYQPFLSRIQSSGAQGTFCFFGGAESVAFVKQYAQFGLSGRMPLYASGFLVEGGVLAAQGDAAVGVLSTLHYTAELDNPANVAFRTAYRAAYQVAPTVYAVQAWDAAAVLSRALEKTGGARDGDSLARAVEGPADSPRGPWTFAGQSPRQSFYLRRVESRGGELVNTVVSDLGPLDAEA
ncbi:ABC transporter substrate-binding protein [Actinoplanes teichomyceticus]|uniref:Amino acid/amide ABC transporter substrate-binding protein (HAAT family) n=1 Tax=Actinoplanes teichomyceticus TaxID=1867 RepID=A0A561WBR9_ACTTI|nr:ABC transporter substrate-binding protein [Actinoplanes teichomyceticus]TWG21283.1 amino acid/amide ABC transporter substrate-binding protein (HAAT family) [Actinoplanes teichomyceticus]